MRPEDTMRAARTALDTAALRVAATALPPSDALSVLRAALWPGDVLVLYASLPSEMVAVLATREKAEVFRLGPTAGIKEAVERARDLRLDATEARRAIAELAARVVAPLGIPAEAKRLRARPGNDRGRRPGQERRPRCRYCVGGIRS